MSLFDIDKNSEDRGSPMPNTHDKLIDGAIKSHKTLSTHYTTDADTNPGRLQMQNKQVLGNDGTTNTTLHGYNQALNKWGFFVTKPGVEVTTNTDLSQFIFNSGQDIFKIVETGHLVVNKPANQLNATGFITSNNIYVSEPVLIYTSSGGNVLSATGPYSQYGLGTSVVMSTNGASAGLVQLEQNAQINTQPNQYPTQITIACTIYSPNWSGNAYYGDSVYIDFKYYLLQETAN